MRTTLPAAAARTQDSPFAFSPPPILRWSLAITVVFGHSDSLSKRVPDNSATRADTLPARAAHSRSCRTRCQLHAV